MMWQGDLFEFPGKKLLATWFAPQDKSLYSLGLPRIFVSEVQVRGGGRHVFSPLSCTGCVGARVGEDCLGDICSRIGGLRSSSKGARSYWSAMHERSGRMSLSFIEPFGRLIAFLALHSTTPPI